MNHSWRPPGSSGGRGEQDSRVPVKDPARLVGGSPSEYRWLGRPPQRRPQPSPGSHSQAGPSERSRSGSHQSESGAVRFSPPFPRVCGRPGARGRPLPGRAGMPRSTSSLLRTAGTSTPLALSSSSSGPSSCRRLSTPCMTSSRFSPEIRFMARSCRCIPASMARWIPAWRPRGPSGIRRPGPPDA